MKKIMALVLVVASMNIYAGGDVVPAPKKSFSSYMPTKQTVRTVGEYAAAAAAGVLVVGKCFRDGKLPAVVTNQKVVVAAGAIVGMGAFRAGKPVANGVINGSSALLKRIRGEEKKQA